MIHIMACLCGVETPCQPEDQQLGRVWQCPACKRVTTAVYPKRGGKAWITIDPTDVAFYGLLDEPEVEEEKSRPMRPAGGLSQT